MALDAKLHGLGDGAVLDVGIGGAAGLQIEEAAVSVGSLPALILGDVILVVGILGSVGLGIFHMLRHAAAAVVQPAEDQILHALVAADIGEHIRSVGAERVANKQNFHNAIILHRLHFRFGLLHSRLLGVSAAGEDADAKGQCQKECQQTLHGIVSFMYL